MRILLVEDDERIVRFVERGLSAHSHQVTSIGDGEDAGLLAADPSFDLMLLDLSLPGLDGQEVLKRVRLTRADLPILVLTARDDLRSKVTALNEGADDYLTKPFAFEELLARIGALGRRADQPRSAELRAGDLRMDLRSRRVFRADREIELSSREFALLEYLMRHPGQVLSRAQILSGVWEYDFDPGSNVVDVYVRYLRRKLDPPGERSLISTLRGSGYRFDVPAGERPLMGP